jgi:hypothetical protein
MKSNIRKDGVMGEFGQPVFYRYYEHQVLKADKFGFRDTIGSDVYLIVFGPDVEDIANPDIEPIGVYHYAGIRRYLWRNAYWSETDWSRRRVKEQAAELLRHPGSKEEGVALRRILELIRIASKCGAPSPTDTHPPLDDILTRAIKQAFNFNISQFVVETNKRKKYCRAVYKINV